MDDRFAAFVLVSALLIVLPGPDMALVTRNALRAGVGAASLTALGVGAGTLGWAMVSTIGVGALLERSDVAFTILKLGGAVYLVYLGIRSLRGSSEREHEMARSGPPATPQEDRAAFFRQGVLGNLLNPKAGAIFVSIIPQFIRPADPPVRLVLMLIAFEAMILVWLHVYGYLVCRAGRSRFGGRVRRTIERATGVVLVGLGLEVAFERATK